MPLVIRTERKASPNYNEDPRARCMDELQRISRDARSDFLGDDAIEHARKFYNVEGVIGKIPSFRPQVQIPQLQVLSLSEATELTDISPKAYIYNKSDGNVDQQRSRAFQEEWRYLNVNHHLLFASLWAQFVGIGFLHFGYDPFADQGLGSIWCRKRDPDKIDWDPAAQCRGDSTYVIAEDRLYPDQVAHYWPETGSNIPVEAISPGIKSARSPATVGTLPPKLRFPEGPMRQMDGPVEGESVEADGRLRVRYLFIDDRTVELVNDYAGGQSARVVDRAGRTDNTGRLTRRLRYPNKRLIVCASGRTSRCVADGDNPTPGGELPFIPIYGLPPLSGFYPPPPTRYSRDLQALCERTLTQIFENIVRLNNGIWFIDKNSAIDLNTFQGLPAEVVEYDGTAKPPQFVTPAAINESVMKLIQWMLATQKELQGYNPSREGTPGQGNLSADLYEASIFQSKVLTRLRARLLACSVTEAANLVFNMMNTNYREQRAYASSEGGFSVSTWKPYMGEAVKYMRLHLDPISLMPISQAALRQMAPMLKELNAIDTETLLTELGIPDAAAIAARTSREMALAALQKAKRR